MDALTQSEVETLLQLAARERAAESAKVISTGAALASRVRGTGLALRVLAARNATDE